MARTRRNGSTEAGVPSAVGTAQQAYVSALTGGVTENSSAIEKIQADIAGLNSQMASHVSALRTHRSQLQTLGVELPEIPDAVLPLLDENGVGAVVRASGRKVRSDKGVVRGAYGPRNGRRARKARPAGRRAARGRPRNASSLAPMLAKVMAGRQMSVQDAAAAVVKAGYKTGSKTFGIQVNQALINSGLFKRVSRGVYSAK